MGDVSRVRGAGSGVMLQKYTWHAKTPRPKAYIVAVHGHAVHARFEFLLPSAPGGKHEVYEGSWIASLNDAGYEFVAFDLPSHGESEDVRGTRCYFERFDDLARDTIGVVEGVRETMEEKGEGEKKIYVLGESLGGGIAVRVALLRPDLVASSGIILTAPMVTLEKVARKGCNPYIRPLASLISSLAPTLPIASVERNTAFPEKQLEMDADEFNYSGPGKLTRARVAAEYLGFSSSLMMNDNKLVRDLACPFITFHSRNDTFTDHEGSEMLIEFAASEDKTLVYCDKMWHALMQEDGKEEIVEQIVEWLDKRM